MRSSTDLGGFGGQATATTALLGRATYAPVCRSDTHPMQCRGVKSFVDDLGLSRGVVLSRAAALLRSIETKPFDSMICPLWTGTSSVAVVSPPLTLTHTALLAGCGERLQPAARWKAEKFFSSFDFLPIGKTRKPPNYCFARV